MKFRIPGNIENPFGLFHSLDEDGQYKTTYHSLEQFFFQDILRQPSWSEQTEIATDWAGSYSSRVRTTALGYGQSLCLYKFECGRGFGYGNAFNNLHGFFIILSRPRHTFLRESSVFQADLALDKKSILLDHNCPCFRYLAVATISNKATVDDWLREHAVDPARVALVGSQ